MSTLPALQPEPPAWWCASCRAVCALSTTEDGTRACADCGGRELTMLVRP